jgi:meso-butanediol dehydrogenase/(S,S)-butanediol dehydrogenase/diacetyl reductase
MLHWCGVPRCDGPRVVTGRENDVAEGSMAGHVALVTGAAMGIGRAIARAFGREGATVIATDVQAPGVEETVALIVGAGGSARAERLDVSDAMAVQRVVEVCQDTYGRLDLAVNNAGVIDIHPLLDFGVDTWQRAFAVNVHGPFAVTTAAGRIMAHQEIHPTTACRGKIINVGSGAADIPRPDFAAYGATKAALHHFTQSSAVALASHTISITEMCPTSVADGMWRDMGARLAHTTGRPEQDIIQERLDRTPGGQFESAASVAEIAVFIATARGMYLNGRRVWTAGFVDERDARAPNQ